MHDATANLRRLVRHVQRRQMAAVLVAVAGVDIRVGWIRIPGAGLIEVVRGWRTHAARQRVAAAEAQALGGTALAGQLEAAILLPADVRVEIERADAGRLLRIL